METLLPANNENVQTLVDLCFSAGQPDSNLLAPLVPYDKGRALNRVVCNVSVTAVVNMIPDEEIIDVTAQVQALI